jgi:hypothetical protein
MLESELTDNGNGLRVELSTSIPDILIPWPTDASRSAAVFPESGRVLGDDPTDASR